MSLNQLPPQSSAPDPTAEDAEKSAADPGRQAQARDNQPRQGAVAQRRHPQGGADRVLPQDRPDHPRPSQGAAAVVRALPGRHRRRELLPEEPPQVGAGVARSRGDRRTGGLPRLRARFRRGLDGLDRQPRLHRGPPSALAAAPLRQARLLRRRPRSPGRVPVPRRRRARLSGQGAPRVTRLPPVRENHGPQGDSRGGADRAEVGFRDGVRRGQRDVPAVRPRPRRDDDPAHQEGGAPGQGPRRRVPQPHGADHRRRLQRARFRRRPGVDAAGMGGPRAAERTWFVQPAHRGRQGAERRGPVGRDGGVRRAPAHRPQGREEEAGPRPVENPQDPGPARVLRRQAQLRKDA